MRVVITFLRSAGGTDLTQGIPSGGVNGTRATLILRIAPLGTAISLGGKRGDNVWRGVFGGECESDRM